MEHDIENAERADKMSVNDDRHDWYAPHRFHPEMAVPQAYDTDRGMVLLKDVEYSTTECPECGTDARKNERSIPQCPDCGILCVSDKEPDHEVVIDPKTANRVDNDGEFIQ